MGAATCRATGRGTGTCNSGERIVKFSHEWNHSLIHGRTPRFVLRTVALGARSEQKEIEFLDMSILTVLGRGQDSVR